MKRSAIRGHAHCSSRISFHFIRATSPETFRDGDSNPRALNRSYVRHVLFVRGASRGRFEAEQDAAPARVVRNHTSGRLGSASGPTTWLCRSRLDGGADEGGEIRWIRVRPSAPGRTLTSPKIAANGAPQGDALSGSNIASHAMPGAKQLQGAPCGAPCPSPLGGYERGKPRACLRGETKSSPRAMRENNHAWLNDKWLFEN